MDALKESKRIWIPFVLAAVFLLVATWTGPILDWVLILSALGLVLDGATKWWSRSSGLTQHRQ